MKKIFSYLSPYKFKMILGFTFKVLGTFSELLLPLIMAYMIDEIAPTEDILLLAVWSVIMFLCALGGLIGNVTANRMASKVARDTTERIRDDLFSKNLALSARQIDKVTIPSLVSRLSSDTYNVHTMVGMMQRLGVRAPILLVGGIALTFTVDPILALILLCLSPIVLMVVIFISKYGIVLYTKLQKSVDSMVRKVRDDYTGIRVIKALSKRKYESESFTKLNNQVLANEKRATLITGISSPLLNLVLNLGMCAVIFVGAYRVNGGNAKVGDIMAFTSYFTIILNAILSISRIFVIVTKGGASAKRIAEILDMEEELIPEIINKVDTSKDFITFDHVSFKYDDAWVLKDISFSLKEGESLGIIGSTGSGKSSLINLLLRFYDPNVGSIYFEGKDLRNLDTKELKEKIGVVFQSDFLMSASIKENVDFERNIDPSYIDEAIKTSSAEKFVNEHGGYEGMLTAKGANFSGGQKQRLLIARALASKPKLLILDDSSSALDYKTDTQLRKTLIQNYPMTTTIMIAQRISSIRFASKILVLNKGEVVGFGSDEELMKNCPTYQDIYRSQHQDDEENYPKGSDLYEFN